MKALASSREGVGPGARAQGPLVGRRAEQGELSAALAGAHAGRGALILLGGEPGIGKTRLAEALAERGRRAGRRGALGRRLGRRRRARLLALDPGDPRAPARPAGRGDRGRPRRRRALRGADRPRGRPRLPAPDRPPRRRSTPRPRASARSTRTASFIRAAAARRPIVIVLDDLHAADVATVRLLEFLARGLHRAHILAIATHRTGETPRDAELAAALADLGNTARRLALGGLSPRRGPRAGRAAAAPSAPPEQIVGAARAHRGQPALRGRGHAPAGGRGRARGSRRAGVRPPAGAGRRARHDPPPPRPASAGGGAGADARRR